MPLRIVRSPTSARLWAACLEDWLDTLGDRPGPEPHAARLWLAHRTQRDAALAAAAERGLPGWFDPPVHFLSELRRLFDIRARPIGVLTGRLLVARMARETGERAGLHTATGERGPARSHMLDGLFGELLSEGVPPDVLLRELARLPGDDFTRARNAWIVETYRSFLGVLESGRMYDARQIHALVAERIEEGALGDAVGGAGVLHIYGLTSLGRRQRMFRALARQADVLVKLYLIAEPHEDEDEWADLAGEVIHLEEQPMGRLTIRSEPDARREAAAVAHRIKHHVVEEGCPPEEIAVVARSGREDTRRLHLALADAGLPSSARLRTTLVEIPALRSLLDLFRGQAAGWDFRSLRAVGTTPYFDIGLDPRPLDFLASERRIAGLDRWAAALEDLASAVADDQPERARRRLWSRGVRPKRVEGARRAIATLAERTVPLGETRPETEWIDFTRTLTAGRAFEFRRRACSVVGDRYDIVRLDQRGIVALDALLAEWRDLVGAGPGLSAADWRDRLRRLLEANELALSTPAPGGIRVLEAHEAALTPFRHTFVVHANDGEFPRTPSGGGILTDRERRSLRAAGLPLEDRALALRRERALWRSVTAGPDVTITYRASTASGLPLLPSLMVDVARDGAGEGAGVGAGTGQAAGAASATNAMPVNRAEHLSQDVRRIERLRRGDDLSEIAVADVHAAQKAVLTAFAEDLRTGELDGIAGIEEVLALEPAGPFGVDRPASERAHAWGGRIRDPIVLAALAERFGPEHTWSASQLEQYGRRPFDFLLGRVLAIEVAEEADEETTPLASGSVLHEVLETLHRRLLDADAPAWAAGLDRVPAVCAEVFERVEREARVWLGLPMLWRLKRRDLQRTAEAFAAWDFSSLARLEARPIAVEAGFGGNDGEPVIVRGVDLRGRETALRLAGRVDRVDRSSKTGGRLRVVDYKLSSVPSKTAFGDGAVLQAALYLRAWELLHGELPGEGVYLSLVAPGKGSKSGLKADRLDEILRLALTIPARIRAGLFEPVQAASFGEPADWQPGIEMTRTRAVISAGTRFDNPSEFAGG